MEGDKIVLGLKLPRMALIDLKIVRSLVCCSFSWKTIWSRPYIFWWWVICTIVTIQKTITKVKFNVQLSCIVKEVSLDFYDDNDNDNDNNDNIYTGGNLK